MVRGYRCVIFEGGSYTKKVRGHVPPGKF